MLLHNFDVNDNFSILLLGHKKKLYVTSCIDYSFIPSQKLRLLTDGETGKNRIKTENCLEQIFSK
jgi:hypothetical protein